MTPLLPRLMPRGGDQLACAIQFCLLGAAFSAANVMLGATASALFLVERGAAELPLFYLVLAAASIPLASALGAVIDRWSRIRIFQCLMLAVAAGVLGLWLLLPLGLAAVPHAVYLASHVLDIAGVLLFWVLASEYFTSRDLRRVTVALAMGLALGGALGGGALALVVRRADSADLLLLLPPILLLMIGQVAWLGRTLAPIAETPAPGGFGPAEAPLALVESLARLPMLMRRYRLVLLMAAGLTLATVLYCVQEYLVFTIYAAAFPDPDDLGRFLAILYAGLQLAEFALLYLVSRPLIARSGPVLRNAVFPLTTLASLGWLGATLQLPAAILCHANTDAAGNAVMEPVRILNMSALPLRILGRVRTVSDGMIYPASIALGGGLLMVMQAHLAPGGIAVLALLGALALLAVEVAVGRSFLPTLVAGLRAGAVDLDSLAESLRVLPAAYTAEVRRLVASADPQARAVGLALALRLHPGALLGEVAALAPAADAATRRAIASVLARAPAAGLEPVVRRLLASGGQAQQLLALQVALARGLRPDAAALAPLRAGPQGPVAALAGLLAAGAAGPAAKLDRESAGALIEAATLGADASGNLGPLVEALGDDDDPGVRAAVLGVVGGLEPTPPRIARAVAGLADPDRRVRRAAAGAVAALGDPAIEALEVPDGDASAERWRLTVRALGGMQSARARARLRAMLGPVLAQAEGNAALMAALPAGRDPARWEALEVGLADSNLRLVERVLAVLAALRRDRVVAEVRRAIGSSDRRTRANAVEALAALPGRGMVAAVLPLVEAVSEPRPAASAGTDDAAIALARRSWDPWVRRGAAALRPAAGDTSEVDMDLILFLRRTRLFGSLPLDTLLALSRVLVAESYVTGETVFADGAPGHCLYLVRAGSVEVRKDGRVLARRGPGAYAGEMALIDDAPRSASVVAAEDCTLLRLDRATFQDLTEDHPAMLRELARLLAANLREANRRLAVDAG